jgi:hypothetical protein
MRIDITSWLSLVTRSSVTEVTASVTVPELEETSWGVSEYRLQAEDMLHWSYTSRAGGEEVHLFCDGREMVHVFGGKQIRSKVPKEFSSMDDPWYFYSWPGVVDSWLVEMLRPVDLLARVVVSSVEVQDVDGLIRMEAEPMGNEPSPYSGFSIPDGRTLSLVLDVDHGCFNEVTVTSSPESRRVYRLIRFQ